MLKSALKPLKNLRDELFVTERDPNRLFILNALPKNAVGCEIGVWKGKFSANLLKVTQPRLLYLIDPWTFYDQPEYEKFRYGPGRCSGQAEMDALYEDVRRKFARPVLSGRVRILRDESAAAAAKISNSSLDYCYVDGNHTYDAVAADLAAFFPKVKPGGFLCGDDYGVEGLWNGGVTRAVDEFCADRGLDPAIRGNQFMIHVPA